MNDRIKLAEAMGSVPSCDWSTFDPFTDANDDYAVLEWMRERDANSYEYAQFRDTMFYTGTSMNRVMWTYEIGDYARAALKVLGD